MKLKQLLKRREPEGPIKPRLAPPVDSNKLAELSKPIDIDKRDFLRAAVLTVAAASLGGGALYQHLMNRPREPTQIFQQYTDTISGRFLEELASKEWILRIAITPTPTMDTHFYVDLDATDENGFLAGQAVPGTVMDYWWHWGVWYKGDSSPVDLTRTRPEFRELKQFTLEGEVTEWELSNDYRPKGLPTVYQGKENNAPFLNISIRGSNSFYRVHLLPPSMPVSSLAIGSAGVFDEALLEDLAETLESTEKPKIKLGAGYFHHHKAAYIGNALPGIEVTSGNSTDFKIKPKVNKPLTLEDLK